MSANCDLGSPCSASAPWGWDRSAALEGVGGDEAILQEVIQLFLVESPQLLIQIEQGLLLHDRHLLEFAAHSLKGELGYLAVPEAYDAAQRLETAGRTGEIEGAPESFTALRVRLAELWTILSKSPSIGV